MKMGITEVIALVQALAIVAGGGWAVYLLWRSSRDRRAEWLWELFTEFQQEPAFRQIRQAMESGKWPSDSPGLDDYLNFLETVAVLCRMRQFERKHSHAVFGYWVELIAKVPERQGLRWLAKYHYAHLRAWAENRPYNPLYYNPLDDQ